ncbi:MAG TPA: hypothetical protein VFN05_10230 [Actinomycetes bacterium]|nr:hypothetical protein [Actinomycetes bacterium]
MATDRDEQQPQQQELEEIRRSFAEMGARMGSLFEPAEEGEPERATAPALPPAPAVERRPRWQLAAVAVLLLLLGTAFGWALGQGGGDDPSPQAAPAPTTAKPPERPTTTTTKPQVRTVVSVPEECVDTAELADEVISRLNRNVRDERLFLALRDYTIASQACRREASP